MKEVKSFQCFALQAMLQISSLSVVNDTLLALGERDSNSLK